MLKDARESKGYTGLATQLETAIQESLPGTLGEDKTKLPKPPSKNDLGRSALAIYMCLSLATEDSEDVDPKVQEAFLDWLVADKAKAAIAFYQGMIQHKVTEREEALGMIDSMRDTYTDNPKRAFAEIRSITNPIAGNVNKKLYPKAKKDIAAKISAINKTRKGGAKADQQEAVNLVNVYRYLCGLDPNVTFDAEYAREAQQAAETCRKAGHIAHTLGGCTDKCNLHQGSESFTPAQSVAGYMQDPGDNNREARGHRAWILFPATGKTGFGKDGGFLAMRTLDNSYSGKPKIAHSYPGRGFFPKEYLHGDGWSYYPPSGSVSGSDATVQMWKLPKSLKSAPSSSRLGKGNEVPVLKVYAHAPGSFPVGGTLVFEPDYSKMKQKDGKVVGTYWIKISWGSYKDEYVVELY